MVKQGKTEDKIVDLKVGKIDLPKIDVSKYIGRKVKIVSANIHEGTYGLYVKALTQTVESIGKTEIKGSKILGLQTDEKGVHGYGEGTKLDLFLKKYKCKDVKDLVGKEVILQSQTSDSGTEFLTFN